MILQAKLRVFLGAFLLAGCSNLPGRPTPASVVSDPDKIMDFAYLFKTNCSGCHGAEGKGGAALSISDPVYLAIADDAVIRKVVSNGIRGTSMPAFAKGAGGMLTAEQVEILVHGLREHYGKPEALSGVTPPVAHASQLVASRVRVKTEISPHLPKVAADSSRLEQVLVNLIRNALDAMPEGGELTLCTQLASNAAVPAGANERSKQFVVVTVADTGIGIPENLQRSIFDPFFTTKPDGEGAGLGLSSAQAIVRQHNGHIDVQSAPGAGSTFRIFLPAKERSASARSSPAARSRQRSGLK